jgi:hypothetical protein
MMRLRGSSLVQFFCELSCPNRREFIRKFFEFAPRGAFQARIPGDFSPLERNRASVFAETLLFDVASLICCAASDKAGNRLVQVTIYSVLSNRILGIFQAWRSHLWKIPYYKRRNKWLNTKA